MRIMWGVKYYRPREIAELGLITRGKSTWSSYQYVLELLRYDQLRSLKSKSGYYLVSEKEIERFARRFARKAK